MQAADTLQSPAASSKKSGNSTQSLQDIERTLSGAEASASDGGAFSSAIGFWKRTAGQLLSREKKLINQVQPAGHLALMLLCG